MKETVNVSLSGIAFIFDQEAHSELEKYLHTLEEGYRSHPDGREIVADIEARIAEIILGKQEPDQVVDSELIHTIIGRMGYPDDMAPKQTPPPVPPREKFSRRLYRNPDGARLGGVCNGIATFLGIDPVWMRLAVFAPLLLCILTAPLGYSSLSGFLGTIFAVAVILYFLLWFAVPAARTPRQKLEMRGERISASTIEKSFREEFSSFSGDRKKDMKTASVWAELVWVLGRITLFCIKVVALLFGILLIGGAVALIVALIAIVATLGQAAYITDALAGFQGISATFFVALTLLVCLLPLVLLIYLLMRLVFDLPAGRKTLGITFAIWLLITVFTGVMAIRNFDVIRQGAHTLEIRSEQREEMPDDDHNDQDEVWQEYSVPPTDSLSSGSTVTPLNP